MRPPGQDGDGLAERAQARGGSEPRAAAVEEFQTALRDTTRLTRLYTILSEPAPLGLVLDRVVLALSELFAADVVALLQAAGPEEYSAVGAIGLPEDLIRRPFSGAQGSYAAAAARSRAPVLIASGRGDARMDAQLRELEVETAVWLPVGGREAMGVLVLARCQPLPFSRSDVDLLMAMAYRIGLVLERASTEEERRRLEARLRQAEKSESLGRMAGAIAHHFNNILSAVMGSLDLALEELGPEQAARREIGYAQEATRQAAKMSGLMLAYLGQGHEAKGALDVVAACREALTALAPTLPEEVRLRTDLPAQSLVVRGNAASVRQVLANLVVNAWEAMPEREGEIAVGLRAVPAAEIAPSAFLSPEWSPKAEAYACLEVADTGSGMDATALRNAFDPFFTTKFPGRGLGLPVVLGTVRAHEGAIAVESEVGRGSAFRIFLPLSEQAPPRPRAPDQGAARPEPSEGLALVVDDEPMIRSSSERMLKRSGFEVLTAADGVEALEVLRARKGEVRFVLLDLTMPRMGGWETLAAMRALRPGMPVILASGYEEAQVMGGEHPERPQVFLQKPFAWVELRAAIDKATAGALPGAPP